MIKTGFLRETAWGTPAISGWQKFCANRAALSALVALVGLAIFFWILSATQWRDPADIQWDLVGSGPRFENFYWFGSDIYGRDLLARSIEGTLTSLSVGLAATLMAGLIGVVWGGIAGYFGGVIDAFMMRTVDILYALPFTFLVIVLMVVFGNDLVLLYCALAAVAWLDISRIVRAQTLNLQNQTFSKAARALGASDTTILFRHILPNCGGSIITYLALTIPNVIMAESFLSFLGLGIQEPRASLGSLVAEGVGVMETAPWALIGPGGLLVFLLLCLNLVGDGLRDAYDPRS